jgi:chorismate synthase/chorismate mutase
MDARPAEYDEIVHKPRPGHADMGHLLKYGRIPVGGGRASGRETVGRVLAGAVARQILCREGIDISGRIVEVGGKRTGHQRTILAAKASKDSVGGIVEVVADGVPPGLGEPVFHGLDAELARALMSIGSVKGVEIGSGFAAARSSGSRNNDAIIVRNGRLATRTNNAGGILGGISNGMPLVCRIAVKPTSSIGLEQDTVDLRTMKPAKLRIAGRHDTCICPRIVPVAEAMVAIVLLDQLWIARKEADPAVSNRGQNAALEDLRERIRGTDGEMVRLIGQRMAIADEIGKRKKALGLPVRNLGAERRVLANAGRAARMAKVAQGIVKGLIEDLMAESRRRQRKVVSKGRGR